MSYWEVMRLPIRAFWTMSGNLNRLFAERDMRLLSVNAAVNGSEGIKDKVEELSQELGRVTRYETVFDADALELLKSSL